MRQHTRWYGVSSQQNLTLISTRNVVRRIAPTASNLALIAVMRRIWVPRS